MPLFHRSTTRANTTASAKNTENRALRRDVVLASATLMNRKQIRSGVRRQQWQEEAWAFWDTIGELHAATTWLGNAMSRVRLFIAAADQDGGGEPAPADNPPDAAEGALTELFGGTVGQGQMMRRIATNLDIVGEVFLVRLPRSADPTADRNSPEYRWIVASGDEFTYAQGRSRLRLPEDGSTITLDPEQTTIIRLWTPHPRVAWEADSQVRSNLPALREVQALSQHITATVESRLAGAGLLAIPKSATLPNPNIQEGANPLHHNAFVDALTQGMITPITDRDNASAVVPIVLSVDDEAIGKIQHLQFWSDMNSQVTEMRRDALQRFASGTDLPQELILGIGESSHWNAAEIEEQAIKIGVHPTASVVCDALTQQYLWPALRAMGEKDPEQWVIWFDTTELEQRPDRSEEAQALYDKGVLSPESLLRENGFNTEDLPQEEDRRKEFARQVVLAKPELLPALAAYVGFPGMEERFEDVIGPSSTGGGAGDQPPGMGDEMPGDGLDQLQTRPGEADAAGPGAGGGSNPIPQQRPAPSEGSNPRPVAASAARTDRPDPREWKLAAIELVTLRALELAGKRLLTNSSRGLRGRPEAQEVHSWDLHTVPSTPPTNIERLLDKAFDLSEPVLGEQPCIQQVIETYCRALIASGRPHRREYLVKALDHAGCLA